MLQRLSILFFALLHLHTGFAQNALPAQERVTRPEFIDEKSAQITNDALRWLASQQNENGSFGSEREYSQNVGVTALCGLAFLCSGSVPEAGPYSQEVEGCLQFLLTCSQANGYLVNTTGETHGPMYGHGFGTMFLAEVYGVTRHPELHDKLKRAVNLIVQTQNKQGGWRYNPVPEDADISVTVCQVMALRAARNAGIAVPKEVIDRAVDYIQKCQNPDGGFRYRLFDPAESKVARSAAAIAALYTAGITQGETTQRGFYFLDQQRVAAKDNEYFFYAGYYSTQAYWHAGGDKWSAAFPQIRNQIIEKVVKDHWEDSVVGNEYATAMALIALQIPNNLVPIFER